MAPAILMPALSGFMASAGDLSAKSLCFLTYTKVHIDMIGLL